MSHGLSVHIEKLNRDNYDTWCLHIEAILVKNDLWGYVDGTTLKPSETGAATIWDKHDRKARADIILSMGATELSHITHCKTSREVWLRLRDVYRSAGPTRKALLMKQLLFTKMSNDGDMQDHIKTFTETADKLKSMSMDVSDDFLSIILLYSIPSSYENFRCAIESRDELPSPETIKVKLLEEASTRKQMTPDQENHGALYARWPRNRRKPPHAKGASNPAHNQKKGQQTSTPHAGSDGNFMRPYKCNFCYRYGHKSSDCWTKNNRFQQHASTASGPEAEVEESMLAYTEKDVAYVEDALMTTTALSAQCSTANDWCIDSGATSHMCRDWELFQSLVEVNNQHVRLAVDKLAPIRGKGTVNLTISTSQGNKKICLENALYVPDLKTNLLSVSKAVNGNRDVIFSQGKVEIRNQKGQLVAEAQRIGDLYFLRPVEGPAAMMCPKADSIYDWHQRYGHLNEADLRMLVTRGMVKGMTIPEGRMPVCKICILGKQTATPFPKSEEKAPRLLLEIVHSDVCGPMRVKSLGGALYFATFIDDRSRWVEVYMLKTKDEVKNAFKHYQALVENLLERKIKILRTDNGLEYCGKEFTKELEEAGIQRERSVAYTPQQNGLAERMNRTLTEMARCMLIQADLSIKFWAEAVSTAAYIRNRCPTKALKYETPYEVWNGVKPDVSNMKTFGCTAFSLNKKPSKGKFEPRSTECRLIGYSRHSKGYRLWDPESKIVIRSRDVTFMDPAELPDDASDDKEFLEVALTDTTMNEIEEDPPQKTEEDHQLKIQAETGRAGEHTPEQAMRRGPGRPATIRTGERGRPKKRYNLVPVVTAFTNYAHDDLTEPSLEEALSGPNSIEWREAMKRELDALIDAGVWTLTKCPRDKTAIGSRWVLKTKYNPDGSIERRKARLVAQGCTQQPGIDFKETYAPVARLQSIRLLVALATLHKMKLYHIDVTMAYIYGDLDEEIYMRQAPGFEKPGEEEYVCRLNKSLYGLKQSGRQWHQRLDATLTEIGLKATETENCFYTMTRKDKILAMTVYVDDLIIATNDYKMFQQVKATLAEEFQIKDLGLLSYCLGIEYEQREPGVVALKQRKYIHDMLAKFSMTEGKTAPTPLEPKLKLSVDDEAPEVSSTEYRRLIGSLMYVAVGTRPDVAYAVSKLSRFCQNPKTTHWQSAKRVLRYLKGTADHELTFKDDGEQLTGYVDSDWAGDIDDRVSRTGYIFKLASAPIAWESRKQQSVALSSTEAEYMALTEATKEAVYIRKILNESGIYDNSEDPTTIYCDNQGAGKLTRNPVYHARTKHIDVKYHYVRQAYKRNEIDIQYISTTDMIADVLTKSLATPSHLRCINAIGVKRKTD